MEEKKTFSEIFLQLQMELSVRNMTHSFYNKFNRLKDNYSKVDFVHMILKDFQFIKELQNYKLRHEKCNEKSLQYRVQGNQQFSLKEYFQAMKLYNKSICYAEPGSVHLALGYANRSAVYLIWKRYSDCLTNIELARKANFPVHLTQKLNKREKECLELLKSQPEEVQPYNFQIKSKTYPNLPNIPDCLKLGETREQGCFIYTTRSFAAGDLIATEDPFCAVLSPEMCYIRCSNCMNQNYLSLIPCENCCSAMFCSEECVGNAMNSFHKYECPIIDFLKKMFNSKTFLPLRICLSAVELFSTIEELMSFCEVADKQKKSVFDLDFSNLTQKEYYHTIHNLMTHQNLRSFKDLFQRAVMCAVLKNVIFDYTPLKDFLTDEKGQNFFIELLFRHILISCVNSHGVDVPIFDISTYNLYPEFYSTGIYPFFSLLNHSCAPNAIRSYKGTKMYLFALRPIPAGSAINDSYISSFAFSPRDIRMKTLSEEYFFKCQCEACKNYYPTSEGIASKHNLHDLINLNIESLHTYDYNSALKAYKECCKILNKGEKNFPSMEIILAQSFFRIVLNVLLDALPLERKLNLNDN